MNLNRTIVNDLNVFPIPDGDTGDNMYMTISSGCTAIKNNNEDSLDSIAELTAKGMLLGARGNSGVILSRIFQGIANGLKGIKEANAETLGKAFACGIDEAYSAVSVPVDGTILTVYKDAVNYANSNIKDGHTLETYFDDFLKELKLSLDRTPDLLEVLKEAGVVDSGGAGIVYIAEGMQTALNGIEIKSSSNNESQNEVDFSLFNEDSELEFGYCTEFLLQLQNSKVDTKNFDIDILTNYLNSVGDSVVCFKEGTIVKVHVHTKTPGDILNHCQQYGEYLKLKIENMTLQHNETTVQNNYSIKSTKPYKDYGIVTVASGDGIVKTFEDLGVDIVIEGAQSMNPSTEDFINAFDRINADTILVFPNNSNVIMTAIQAANLYDKANIEIISSKTIGEGYAAISMLDTSSKDTHKITKECQDIISEVVTGHVSIATRDAHKDNVEIKENNYIGFTEDKIYLCNENKNDVALGLCDELKCGNYDILLLIQGKDTSDEDANNLLKELEAKYRRTESILIKGNQPIYDYIIILE